MMVGVASYVRTYDRAAATVMAGHGRARRYRRLVGLSICLMAFLLTGAATALTRAPQSATPADVVERTSHTTTLLADGRVLVAGGRGLHGPLASAAIFDPVLATWTATGSMVTARYDHTATLLPDGHVLVAGGSDCQNTCTWRNSLASAELFDPITGTWKPTTDMAATRTRHAAALLADGRVLVAGGEGLAADATRGGTLRSAEIYDPTGVAWASAAPMHLARRGAFAVSLPDHQVALMSGNNSAILDLQIPREEAFDAVSAVVRTGEIYDAVSDTWRLSVRGPQTVSFDVWWMAVPSGLVVGIAGLRLDRVVTYDPAADAWTEGPISGRTAETSFPLVVPLVRLADGPVLVSGGRGGPSGNSSDEAFIFDPATFTWTQTGSMASPREGHTAITLASGRVLVFGGNQYLRGPQYGPVGISRRVPNSELYDRVTGEWTLLDQPPITPPPVASGGLCPIAAEACRLAAQLDRWLGERNVAAVADEVSATDLECSTAEENRRRDLEEVCAGAQPGEHRAGYEMVFGGLVGGYFSRQDYEAVLLEVLALPNELLADALGSGRFRLIGFACLEGTEADPCSSGYAVLFSWMSRHERTGDPERDGLVFVVRQADTAPSPRIASTGLAPIAPGYIEGFIPWSPPGSVP